MPRPVIEEPESSTQSSKEEDLLRFTFAREDREGREEKSADTVRVHTNQQNVAGSRERKPSLEHSHFISGVGALRDDRPGPSGVTHPETTFRGKEWKEHREASALIQERKWKDRKWQKEVSEFEGEKEQKERRDIKEILDILKEQKERKGMKEVSETSKEPVESKECTGLSGILKEQHERDQMRGYPEPEGSRSPPSESSRVQNVEIDPKGDRAQEGTSRKKGQSKSPDAKQGSEANLMGIDTGTRSGRKNIREKRRRGIDAEYLSRERTSRERRQIRADWNGSVEVKRSPSRCTSPTVSPTQRSPPFRSPARKTSKDCGSTELSSLVSASRASPPRSAHSDEFGSVSPICTTAAETRSRSQTPQRKKTPEIPRPLPPQLSSADHQSITLEWVGCPVGLCYHLEMAPKKSGSEKGPFKRSVSPGSPLRSVTPEPPSDWVAVYCGKDCNYKVENLKPGREYLFRIRSGPAVVPPNLSVSSPPSKAIMFSTLPCAPDSPSMPTLVYRYRTSLKVTWNAPAETGGVDISEYWLEVSPPLSAGVADPTAIKRLDEYVRVYCGKETSAKVGRLAPGTSYKFRVLAANSAGTSPYSIVGTYKTAPSVPEAPLPPTLISSTSDSLSVSWQEPHDCGSPINSYTLERDVGRSSNDPKSEGGPFTVMYIGDEKSCSVESLKSGYLYRVRVSAQNEVGKGPRSTPAEFLTNFCPPDPPPLPDVTGRGARSVSVGWSAPEIDGGSPIIAYELEIQSVSLYHIHREGLDISTAEPPWVLSYYGPCTAHTLTGLRHGHQYRVHVRAVNIMGKGGFSDEAPFSTAPGAPDAPSALMPLEVGSRKCTVGWRLFHNGGSSITAYRLEMKGPTGNGSGEDTSATGIHEREEFVCLYRGVESSYGVEGLHPGTSYSFRVQAYNKYGCSTFSSTAVVKTPPAIPSIPIPPILVGNPTASGISLKWSAPLCNGAPIETYQLQMLMLGCGDQHVHAHDLICPGEVDTMPSPGGRKKSQITIPEFYEEELQRASTGLPQLSPVLSGSLVSSFGNVSPKSKFPHPGDLGGVWTQIVYHSHLGHWQYRSILKHSRETSEAEVFMPSWHQGGDLSMSFPEDDFEQLKERKDINNLLQKLALQEIYGGTSTAYTISKLQTFTQYAFRVQAKNAVGPSGFSPFTVATTAAAPPCAPRRPTAVKATITSLTLQWEVPEQDNGSLVYKYSLQMAKVRSFPENFQQDSTTSSSVRIPVHKRSAKQDADASTGTLTSAWEQIYHGPALQHKVMDLIPARQYSFRVVAHNDVGASPPSASVEVSTSAAAPEAPHCPTFGSVTPTTVRIRWSPPVCDNGSPITSYRLLMDDGRGGPLMKIYEGPATSFKETNLVPTLCYRAAVQAFNALGASFLSECSSITLPVAPPVTPPIPKFVAATEHSIIIHWLKLSKDATGAGPARMLTYTAEGTPERTYTVEMEDCNPGGKIVQVYEGTSTRYEMKWVKQDHVYRFRVRTNGVLGGGCSAWSPWSIGMTVKPPSCSQPELAIPDEAPYDWSLRTRRCLAVLGIVGTIVAALLTGLASFQRFSAFF